jgi:hypothetical protein
MPEPDRRVIPDGPRASAATELAERESQPAGSTFRAVPRGSSGTRLTAVSAEDLLVLYGALMEADDHSDVPSLVRLGWHSFSMICSAQYAHSEAVGMLSELCAAARATVAGQGSPASLALLRAVLAKHGWLPPPGATPLQVIAAPAPEFR